MSRSRFGEVNVDPRYLRVWIGGSGWELGRAVDHPHIQPMRQPLSHVLCREMATQFLARVLCHWSRTPRMRSDEMELVGGSAGPQVLADALL